MRAVCILLLGSAIAACGGGDKTAGNVANLSSPATVTPGPEKTADTPQTVTIDSPDGVKLVGSFYETKPMTPALLLLHQWQSNRHAYDDFAKKMQRAGFNVLAIDGRGFGESTKKADGSNVSAGRMNTDVMAMIDDVGAAFDFLAKNKLVDPKRIGIVGASYGSSLALIYAANKREVGAVALLSPGLNYFGNMQMAPAMKKYAKRPVYMVAADDDSESAVAIKELPPLETVPQQIKKTYVTGGHGTALLKSQPGLADELQVFFAEHLKGAAK